MLLVTEPTAFGLHDLKVAVTLMREMSLPCAVVINRAGKRRRPGRAVLRRRGVPLLPGMPFRRDMAEIDFHGSAGGGRDPGNRRALR